MLLRYYPSSESFLLNLVKEDDLYDYIFHGFALCSIDGFEKYVSYCFTKQLLLVDRTPEMDEIFRQKDENCNNISGLIKLLAKLKHINIHYGNHSESWKMIGEVLANEEYKTTLDNFKNTIASIINRMFPGYSMM